MTRKEKVSVCGIYAIVNRHTGERYVGQSENIPRRWAKHQEGLRNGQATPALQQAWDQYGEGGFEFVVLRTCSKNHLDALEEAYMAQGCEYNGIKNTVFSLGVNYLDDTVKAGPGPAAAWKADDLSEEDLDELAQGFDAKEEPPDEDAEEWERIDWENNKKIDEFESRYNNALNENSLAKQKQVLLDHLEYTENDGLALTRKLRDFGLNPVLPGHVYEMLAKLYRREKDYKSEIGIIKHYFSLSVEDRNERLAVTLSKRLIKAEQLFQKS